MDWPRELSLLLPVVPLRSESFLKSAKSYGRIWSSGHDAADEPVLSAVLRDTIELGGEILRCNVHEPSLEDVYLERLGGRPTRVDASP